MEEKGEYPTYFFFKEREGSEKIQKLTHYSMIFYDTLKATTTHVKESYL